MPKLPRITATEAQKLLLDAGFILVRTKGSHRIYIKDDIRVVVPFSRWQNFTPKNCQTSFKGYFRK